MTAVVSDADVRRWLSLLHRPDRLAGTDLAETLVARGVVPAGLAGAALGKAARNVVVDAIDALKPADGASREQALPHAVLRTCFVDGLKLFQAANRLGMSERQLSRERSWAVGLLRTELETRLARKAAYAPAPIPAIGDYLKRPATFGALERAVAGNRLVIVSGPPGIGKTSLVAELATAAAAHARVFWYRFRPGVSDSLRAVLYELGGALAHDGAADLAGYIAGALPEVDTAFATRLAIGGLGDAERLLVFDDFHVVERDASIAAFVEEVTSRLDRVRVVLLSRQQDARGLAAAGFAVPVLTGAETRALLAQLGVAPDDQTATALHAWTSGVPHLVHLAAAWLRTASPEEVSEGMAGLAGRAAVQEFLLGTITDLLDPDDREILEAASVFRAPFNDDALATVAGRSRGAVQDAVRRLVRAHAATRSRDGTCAFFHASVREYVHDRLPAERLAVLHPRAAAWFAAHGQRDEAAYHKAQTPRASVPRF